MSYKFYKQLPNLSKINKISEVEIRNSKDDFIKPTKYLARQKYIKKQKLNGYKFVSK